MQYEIAHCRHATEGAVSRLWYTLSWLEEKALPRAAVLHHHPNPSPTALRRRRRQGGGGREGGGRPWRGTSMPLPDPGIKTSESESRMTTVHFRIGEDSWHVNHRCRSVLDDQSYAAMLDTFKETRRVKESHWQRGGGGVRRGSGNKYQKRPRHPSDTNRNVLLPWSPNQLEYWTLENVLALKSSFFSASFFFRTWEHKCVIFRPARSERVGCSEAGLQVPRGQLAATFLNSAAECNWSGKIFTVPSDQWACFTPVPNDKRNSFKGQSWCDTRSILHLFNL